MSYENKHNIDFVFCIDCSASMSGIFDCVKTTMFRLIDESEARLKQKGRVIDKLRVRIVAFRDYLTSQKDRCPPMLASPFVSLPEEEDKLVRLVGALECAGGSSDGRDGLEALGFAMCSDWNLDGFRRHIITLFTNAAPNELGHGKASAAYPKGMARDMDELTAWWENGLRDGGKMSEVSRRLLLFAPDEGGWNYISENWTKVIHYSTPLNLQEPCSMDFAWIVESFFNNL